MADRKRRARMRSVCKRAGARHLQGHHLPKRLRTLANCLAAIDCGWPV